MAPLFLTLSLLAGTGQAQPAQLRPASHLLMSTDQSVGHGVKQMLLGGAMLGAGAAGLLFSGALLVVAAFGVGVALIFFPALGEALLGPVMAVAAMVAALISVGSVIVLALGTLWFLAHAILVIIRLNPDYQPSPATEYPPV